MTLNKPRAASTAFYPELKRYLTEASNRFDVIPNEIVADDSASTNPRYSVYTSDSATPQVCFSKAYGDPPNPSKGYCAVMTCSQADDACPLVMGCDLRMPIRYEDPKVADDTELESQRYDERSAQICTEMLYMMSLA